MAQKHIVAETGLNEAQTGKILDAPYDLTVKENGLSEREKTKDNAKVTAALGGIDKAIAQHQQNIASYGAAGGQNATHAQKVAYAQKSEIAENEILRLQGMKDSYTNDQRNSAYAQLKASRNPQSRDLAAGLNEIQPEDTAGKIVQKELGKIQEDQAIAGARRVRGTGFLGTGIGSTKWNAGGGGARLQPPGKAGEQNDIQALYKSIPQASHDLNSMQDGGIYVFPSGAGIFHKQTGMVTKLTFQDLVQTLRAQRQQ